MGIVLGEDDGCRRLLVVAAHADDEVLGAGGTLAACVRADNAVRVLILSVSSLSRDVSETERERLKSRRMAAAREVADRSGWSLALHDLPDSGFDTVPFVTIAKLIENEVRRFEPTTVITHYPGDLARDHQVTAAATATAVRPCGRHLPPALIYFEIRSSTEWSCDAMRGAFQPSLWSPLSDESWRIKREALQIYADELRDWPHPRSLDGIEALARMRGSEIGVARAEAFLLARGVVNCRESGCSPARRPVIRRERIARS